MKRRAVLVAAAAGYATSLLAGFLLTRVGTTTWDTAAHRDHMLWLIGRWQGQDRGLPYDELQWAGPLWEYVLAAFEAAFAFLRDPFCVRHAATFTLLPVTVAAVFLLLRRAGETRATAALAVALLLGNVRLVGHSILNVKDFPLACLYALATLWMWSVLHRETAAGLLSRPRSLVALSAVSVLPYLMQPPVLTHWLLLCALCLLAAVREGAGLTPWQRWTGVLLPVVTGPLVAWAVWPPLWDRGLLGGLAASFSLFSRFPWRGTVRVLGSNYVANELPRWYGPFWIPLSWEPFGFVLLAAGVAAFLVAVARGLLRMRRLSTSVLTDSLPLWVALFAAAPWLAVVALRPVLYDEDRHLLFAMPLLAVAAALGLRGLGERWKAGLAALACVATLATLVSWGKYSYVYRSPLLRTAAEDFKGDYWGISSGAMAQALYDHVPDGAWVVVAALPEPVTLEVERRQTSRLVGVSPPKWFRLELKGPPAGDFYVLATNRGGTNHRILEDIAAGKAREIWRDAIPGADPGAVLAFYTEPCPHCRLKVRQL